MAILIWRLLIYAISVRIIRHLNNHHNYPLERVILNCHNSPTKYTLSRVFLPSIPFLVSIFFSETPLIWLFGNLFTHKTCHSPHILFTLHSALHSPLFSARNPQTLPFTLHYAWNLHSHHKDFTLVKPSLLPPFTQSRQTLSLSLPLILSLQTLFLSRPLTQSPQNLTLPFTLLAKTSLHTLSFVLFAIIVDLKHASSQWFQSFSVATTPNLHGINSRYSCLWNVLLDIHYNCEHIFG